jgi:hypothetical protein
MRTLLLSILFLTSALSASQVCLKDRLAQASEGSFLVLEQNKTFTFLHIHQKNEKTLIFEEVSGHTCWLMSEIDLGSGALRQTFSFTHKGWIDMSDSNPFLTTLLNIKFHEIPLADRRKVGLAPPYHKEDRRPVWHPRLVLEGRLVPYVPFRAYRARWPADGSELSRKDVEIYLPEPQENLAFPLYFPYWLEVDGKIGSAKARVVDSGIQASSPKGSLPKRSRL